MFSTHRSINFSPKLKDEFREWTKMGHINLFIFRFGTTEYTCNLLFVEGNQWSSEWSL